MKTIILSIIIAILSVCILFNANFASNNVGTFPVVEQMMANNKITWIETKDPELEMWLK